MCVCAFIYNMIPTERSGHYVKGSRFQHAEKLQFAKVCGVVGGAMWW